MQNLYGKKIFTPPLAFYERLEWLLNNCEVETLIFNGFTFTDLFVEKFEEYFAINLPFLVKRVWLHNCNLRICTSKAFHRLLGDLIKAEEYYLNFIRRVKSTHVNSELLAKPNIERYFIKVLKNYTHK